MLALQIPHSLDAKYRFRILEDNLEKELYRIIYILCGIKNVKLWNLMIQLEHVHLVVLVPPKISISTLMDHLKVTVQSDFTPAFHKSGRSYGETIFGPLTTLSTRWEWMKRLSGDMCGIWRGRNKLMNSTRNCRSSNQKVIIAPLQGALSKATFFDGDLLLVICNCAYSVYYEKVFTLAIQEWKLN